VATARIELPPKLVSVFTPARGELRYRGAYGGRGSAKSFTFAKMAAIWGYAEPLRILCTRDIQDSIKQSFHAELKNAIASEPWLAAAYDVGIDYLRGKNGTEFLFKGLRHGIGSIKSTAQIDLCIVEEAEDVPEYSWEALEPTIRAPKSEIWVIWNPRDDGSPVDQRFRKTPPPRSMMAEMNYSDNPWFPPELEEQRQHALRTMDAARYAHIWEGDYLRNSESQIFSGKFRVDEFTPGKDWDGPYYGLDFGFAQDPTAGVKCWIHDRRLFIEYEAGRVGLELDDTPEYVRTRIPGIEKHTVRADCARPESISYLQRHGIPRIQAVEKWSGSVEDGIEFMRSFREIVIHPRCKETHKEFRLYSYKTDRKSGDILPVIEDANNHYIDAIRYALGGMIRQETRPGKPAMRMNF
jgi:phage terminase large subunit